MKASKRFPNPVYLIPQPAIWGTEYAWREVVVTIAPDGNHKAAQEKLVAAVNAVYSPYREEIERQHYAIERHVDIQAEVPRPEARLQFADAGLELLVRYPVEIRKAPDIDEEMTRKILDLIETDEALKAAVSGNPKIRSAVKGMKRWVQTKIQRWTSLPTT